VRDKLSTIIHSCVSFQSIASFNTVAKQWIKTDSWRFTNDSKIVQQIQLKLKNDFENNNVLLRREFFPGAS